MANRWFRMYDEILEDPKVQKLPDDLFKAWVNCLALASRHGGTLPSVPDIAFAFRMPENAVITLLDRLSNATLIDRVNGGPNGWRYAPHSWAKRQYKSDTSTPRVKRFREKKGALHETAPEAEADTDTDTDTVLLGAQPKNGAELEGLLRQAAGWNHAVSPMLAVTGPIESLLAAGADLERDVLDVIRSKAPRMKRPANSWNYFVQAIADARDARLAALTVVGDPEKPQPKGYANGRRNDRKGTTELVFEALAGRDLKGPANVRDDVDRS